MAQATGGKENGGKAVSDSLSLNEVVVKGERTVNRDNTLHLLPTKEQKEASTTGYGLLSRLALPLVTVNEVTKTISVPPNMGQLQVRINDIVADKHDLTSLDPKTVRRVDFLQNPGARYGMDVDYVIRLHCRGGTYADTHLDAVERRGVCQTQPWKKRVWRKLFVRVL